ncbi:MAG: calcium-binding protein, partial [Propionicimonas sp.]|nr:calcium-binding protein [Propionicimonas sp.]
MALVSNSFLLEVSGKVSILRILNFDAGLVIRVDSSGWYLRASASMDFFGFAGLSGSIELWSNGDFNVQLSGRLVIGSSSFGIVGEFHFGLTSRHYDPANYRFLLTLGASVDVRVFGITLVGAGISASFGFDTADADANGRVKVELSITVRIKILFITISKTARFTIGYLQIPRPTFLAGSQAAPQVWTSSDHVLYLNTGDRAGSRNIATDEADESFTVEQVGTSSAGATIKVSAFGRTNTYTGVTRIVGDLGGGNDQLFISPSVQVPVEISAGEGNDLVVVEGAGSLLLSGGGGDDDLVVTGTRTGSVDGGAGNDYLMHEGSGAVDLVGGSGDDSLIGALATRSLNAGAGADYVEAVLGTGSQTIVGGSESDALVLRLTGGSDGLKVSRSGVDLRLAATNPGTGAELGPVRIANGFEDVTIDAGDGSDTIVVEDITGATTGTLSLVLGAGGTDRVSLTGTAGADAYLLDHAEHPDEAYGLELRVRKTGAFTLWLVGAVRGQGDALAIDAREGDDTISAAAMTVDSAALTLVAGDGDDVLIGSPYADILDSGAGDDRVTGGPGQDVFRDGSGTDTLVETAASDIGLYDNLLVMGHLAPGGVDFLAGATAEDLGGQFERAELSGSAGPDSFLVGDADGFVAVGTSRRTALGWTGLLAIQPGGGDDTVRVELRNAGNARITVAASDGNDTLLVYGTSQREDIVVTAGQILASSSITGTTVTLGFAVEAVTIGTGDGSDRVAVRAIGVPHTIDLGGGDDIIAVGSQAGVGATATTWPNPAGTLDQLGALLSIRGGLTEVADGVFQAGYDVVLVSDALDTSANTGVLSSNLLTGLGMADGISYLGFEAMDLRLGSGGDQLTILSTHAGPTAVDAGAGNDLLIVGAGPQALTGMDGALSISAGAGSDELRLDATGSTANLVGTLDQAGIVGLGMPGSVSYRPGLVAAPETLRVDLGSGDDQVAIPGTSTATFLNGGPGADRVVVNPADVEGSPNALGGRLGINGQAGADTTVVHLWANGSSRIDISDTDLLHTLVLYGSANADTILMRANADGSRGLVALLSARGADGLFDAAELVTYQQGITGAADGYPAVDQGPTPDPGDDSAGNVAPGVRLYTQGGDDVLAFDDSAAAFLLDMGEGNDLVRVGQIYKVRRAIDPADPADRYLADVEFGVRSGPASGSFDSSRGLLSAGVRFDTTISGGGGNDIFELVHNIGRIWLYGDDGDDTFVVRSFVSATSIPYINLGAGNNVVQYAANAKVAIDGGAGNDTVILVGTEGPDVYVITADGIYGGGRIVTFVNIEHVVLYGQEGDDEFRILSTLATVSVTVFGGLGSDTIRIGGASAPVTVTIPATSTTPETTTTVTFTPTTLARIQGPVFASGGFDPDPPYNIELDVYLPILLPGEFSGPPFPVETTTGQAVENAQVDELVIDDSVSTASPAGTVTSQTVTGLGMATGGVGYGEFESLRVLLGSGADRLVLVTTHHGTTEVDAGAGADLVTVRTIDGHTRILGGAGNDTIEAGSSDSLLDLLSATLVVDGGSGDDVLSLDDSGDTGNNLGWLTRTTLTGLDMIARTALDALGRPLDLLYSVLPLAGVAQYTLTLAQLGVATALGSVVVDVATTTAADLATALQNLLYPLGPEDVFGRSTSCGLAGET